MKRFLYSLTAVALSAAFLAPPAMAAEEEKPCITFKTNAFNELGETNQFSIMLSATKNSDFYVDAGFGETEVPVVPATFDTETGALKGTVIPCRVSAKGEVKIYGDASLIDVFNADGCYITELDINQCTNLEIISLQHNELKALDLTPFTKAQAIYMTDNPFTAATPLKIGAPKPDLQILEVDIIGHFDQSFNLSDYPNIASFDGYATSDINKIDPTGCPNLLVLSLDMTNVATVDVSKNAKLMRLNVADSKVTTLDLSHNPLLEHLIANHTSGTINTTYKFTNIDLSKNPNLALLYLGGNALESIDLSNNTKLTHLGLQYNKLTHLDLSKNTELYSINLNGNYFDFATLPAPQQTWGEYFYTEQDLPVARALGVGQPLDLATRVLRTGTETTAVVYQKFYDKEPELIDASLYKYANGIITFNQAVNDSVYVVYSNSLLNEYKLQTAPFKVKPASEMGKPSLIASFTPAPGQSGNIQFSVGMAGATMSLSKVFMVDFGDGKLTQFETITNGFPTQPNVTKSFADVKGKVSLYAPEESVITSFKIDGVKISDIDVTKATELRQLQLNNCGLDTIDLKYNRCLQLLDLSHNNLANVDLQGIYGNYEKYVLRDINISYNSLASCNIVAKQAAQNLDLSNNLLSEFSLKDFDNLATLNLSNNLIKGELNLAYQAVASSINLNGNKISRVIYDTFQNLTDFDLRNNDMTIETLPDMPEVKGYLYAPQNKIQLLENAPAVNLSDQNRVIVDNKGTTFVWRKASNGAQLVEGKDITCKDGATIFLDDKLGKVYCEMSNPAFPQFAGANLLTTTEVNVVGPPTKVVATFQTLENGTSGELSITGHKKTALYIDWRGDGSEYLPYEAISDTNTRYGDLRTFAGATVKVYTYDEPTDLKVFSISGMPLGNFDGTPMTALTTISLMDAGLTADKMNLPKAPIGELNLTNNALTSYPYFEQYPDVFLLSLNKNHLSEFDASPLAKLQMLYISDNDLKSIKLNNANLWELALNNNQLDSIDFSAAKNIEQMALENNHLASIDIQPLRRKLRVLSLAGNRFTFATLPIPSKYPNLLVYYYSNQANIEAIVSNNYMTYDLSSQAMVDGAYPTTYTWFLGEPTYNSEDGTLSGETLLVDDEYVIKDGVTTFNTRFDEDVVCVMTNPIFSSMYLRTPGYRVGFDDIEEIGNDAENAEPATVDVYTISGMIVKRNVAREDALQDLPKGLYIVGGKKVFVK